MNRRNRTRINLTGSYILAVFFSFHVSVLFASECPNIAKDQNYHFVNQRRSARVILEKFEAPNRYTWLNDGSGILISQYGYILTARHIIEKAIDFDRKDGKDIEVPRTGYRIRIRFFDGLRQEDTLAYDAQWIETWKRYDLALLRLRSPDARVFSRGQPIIYPAAQWSDKCFEILGMAYWPTKLSTGVDGPEQPRYERATASFIAHPGDWKVALKATVTHGFSGAPVFYADKDWYLVGIITSSRQDRENTKYMRDLSAIYKRLEELVPGIAVRSGDAFPSPRIQSLTDLNFNFSSVRQLKIKVTQLLINDAKRAKAFVDQILLEDFRSARELDDSSKVDAEKKGLHILETVREFMYFNQGQDPWTPDLFSKVTDKIINVWDRLGVDMEETRFKEKLVVYLIESSDFKKSSCKPMSNDEFRCLLDVDRSYEQLTAHLARFYDDAWNGVWSDSPLHGETTAASVVLWSTWISRALRDWGEVLQRIGTLPPGSFLVNELPGPTFLGGFPQPDKFANLPKGVPFLAAAVDKVLFGIGLLPDLNDPRLKSVKGRPVDKDFRQFTLQLCGQAYDALETLRRELKSDDPVQNNYLATVKAFSDSVTTESSCARIR
jgi:hypothetical protein